MNDFMVMLDKVFLLLVIEFMVFDLFIMMLGDLGLLVRILFIVKV